MLQTFSSTKVKLKEKAIRKVLFKPEYIQGKEIVLTASSKTLGVYQISSVEIDYLKSRTN